MQELPVGLQSFKKIRIENFLYVDKTKQIYQLLKGSGLFFLSRPRRFGKTLLVSTLKEIFKGEKDLFRGLYLYEESDWAWEKHPVLQFNFAAYGRQDAEGLVKKIKAAIAELAEAYQVEVGNGDLQGQFKSLIKVIAKKHGNVVILMDEYDKPIIDFLDDFSKADANRAVLKDFFSPLKEMDEAGHLRFLFITGISKFSKVSIFSDLNNLTDLTLAPQGADLIGITQEELENYFKEYINEIATKVKKSKADLLDDMKSWYNGYTWDVNLQKMVYNPFSLLNYFAAKRFANYWFATGTPTFLVKMIRKVQIDVELLENYEVIDAFFDKFNIKNPDIFSLLFQTGYLTIKSVKERRGIYRFVLSYPNKEVRSSFIHNLLEAFTFKPPSTVSNAIIKIEDSLHDNKMSKFIEQLQILFSSIAYQLQPPTSGTLESSVLQRNFDTWEGYFHTIIYLVLSFLDIYIECEVSRHKGRLDAVVNTENHLYLMEFKLEASAEIALEQIKEKDYAASYLNIDKKIILLGVDFDRKTRNVKHWKAEEWKK
ncbi:MAG: AAA family ATPase [Bacteroidota bacterium]